jgi:AcrR family transcriptional regulator
MSAAERLFAEHGFTPVSVRRITADAGCNLAAVNYHFGGKLGLYRETFRRRLALMRERRIGAVRRVLEDPARRPTLELVLRTFAEAFLEPFVADSEGRLVLSLIARETFEPQLPPEIFRSEMAEPVRRVLVDAIAGVARGASVRSIELCVESLIAQLVHALRLECLVTHRTPGGLPRLEEVTAHIVRFSAAGIRAYADRPAS